MSYERGMQTEVEATASSLASTADIYVWTPGTPVEVYEFGVIVTTTLTATDNLIIVADKRPIAASDTGRGDADVGTLTVPAADSGGIVAGDVIISRQFPPVLIEPGQQVVIQITNAVAAGDGFAFINYRPIPRVDREIVADYTPVVA